MKDETVTKASSLLENVNCQVVFLHGYTLLNWISLLNFAPECTLQYAFWKHFSRPQPEWVVYKVNINIFNPFIHSQMSLITLSLHFNAGAYLFDRGCYFQIVWSCTIIKWTQILSYSKQIYILFHQILVINLTENHSRS